jgi:response regulator RpfG family c-di-GMP phosphodiesterase
MGILTVIVLTLMTVATLWLLYYSRTILPRQLDERTSESVKAFGIAIELRFPSHKGLSKRVISLSDAVARQMKLAPQMKRDLELAGRLRDIGLCSVPYRLVNELSPSEWNVADKASYLRHADVGGAMLETIPELSRLAAVVRYHHNRYDGADDPTDPCGLSLPMEARILKTVADYVWYERLQGSLIAREILKAGRGSAYCPQAADALLTVLTSTRVEQREHSLV